MKQRRVGVRGIIWLDGKLLAVKHKRGDDGEADFWAIPGGGLDPQELLTDGVKREMIEETAIEPNVGRLLFMQQFKSTRDDCDEELEFFYHIENPEDFTDIDLSKTSHGLEEIARIEFIDPKEEYILPAFLHDIDIAEYVDQNQPVYLFDQLTTS